MPRPPVQLHHDPGLWPLTWPMGLTMLRLLLLPVFLWVLLSDVNDPNSDHDSNRRWAVAIFAVMAATDKLDGYLARKLNQASRIGALLDPVADKLLIATSVIVLSFQWAAPPGFRIPTLVVAIIYGKDLLVGVGVLVLLSIAGKVTITPRPLGKIATFIQLVLVILTLLAPDLARLDEPMTVGAFRAVCWLTILLTVAASVDYMIVGVKQLNRGHNDVV
jgi:cardiolipin synthase